MDAMSDAVEGAAVMLFSLSTAYKESANCRLEVRRPTAAPTSCPRLLYSSDAANGPHARRACLCGGSRRITPCSRASS